EMQLTRSCLYKVISNRADGRRTAKPSERLAVLDEAGTGGNMVIEPLGRLIVLVCVPIKSAGLFRACQVRDGVYQQCAYTVSPLIGFDIEILQIATPIGKPAGTMKNGMDDSNKAVLRVEGTERIHMFGLVMEAAPG